MGLDLVPTGRPKAGCEKEHRRLFNRIVYKGGERDVTGHLERWLEISISPHETLGAPRVGEDDDATTWAQERYRREEDPPETEDAFLARLAGYRVLELVEPSAALPVYHDPSDGAERFAFRGQFLLGEAILGALDPTVAEQLYVPMVAADLADLGWDLGQAGDTVARRHGCEHEAAVFQPPEGVTDGTDPRHVAHVLASASRWCTWWAERGHGMEPTY